MASTSFASKPLRKVYPIYPATIDEFQRPNVNDFRNLTLRPEMLQEPFHYGKSARVFTNSVSDPFHVAVPFTYVNMMLQVMGDCPQHQFQMLTKRADRMAEYFACRKAPNNVWVGVSVENRKHGLPRIKHLQSVNARIRWLSVEPLIEDLGELDLSGIHWVVVGGESGSKHVRPMHIDWVRSIRDQCVASGVPFFFKQFGSHDEHGVYMHKSKTGRLLDGVEWNEFPDSAFFGEPTGD
jgi:protein gp37